MKRFTQLMMLGMICSPLMMSGCAHTTTQAENKQAAYGRWSATRANVMYSMAVQQYETGDLYKASESIKRAIDTKPDDPRYHVLAARILLENGKLERAYLSVTHAIELNEKHYDGHYLLGVILQRWEKFDEALASYERAYELRSDDESPLLAIAQMYVRLGRTQEAIKRLEGKLVYFEHNAAIRAALGRIYMIEHDYVKAVATLSEAHVISPDDPSITEFLIRAYQGNGQHGQAIELLNRLGSEPEYALRDDHQAMLADSYVAVGQPEQARPIYLSLTRKNPQNYYAWLKLAEVAWAVGDTSRVVKASRQASALNPTLYQPYMLLGMVEAQAGRFGSAVKLYEKANVVNPKATEPYLLKGIALERLGQRGSAVAAYEQVLKLNPNDERAKQLLQRVTVLSKG